MDLIVILIAFLLTFFVLFIQRKYSYWKNLGVFQCDVEFPYGNFKNVGSKFHVSQFLCDFYQKTKEAKQKISGFYLFIRPILMVVDLDTVKSILVKDFNIFPNRGLYYNEKDDPISAHMFNLENDSWRMLR